jgi:hypothetical protein
VAEVVIDAFYLVEIQGGNPGRAAGLLADSGIQNVNYRENAVAARLRAQDAASAVARVEGALAGEQFVIGQARREHDPRSV